MTNGVPDFRAKKTKFGLITDATMEDEVRMPRHSEPGHRGADWISLTAEEFMAYMVPHELTKRDAPVLVRAGQLRRLLQMVDEARTMSCEAPLGAKQDA